MKLERSTAVTSILILFYLGSIWISFFSKGLVPILLTIFFCIPWVVRKTGKLLKEAFDSCEPYIDSCEPYICDKEYKSEFCKRPAGHKANHVSENYAWVDEV